MNILKGIWKRNNLNKYIIMNKTIYNYVPIAFECTLREAKKSVRLFNSRKTYSLCRYIAIKSNSGGYRILLVTREISRDRDSLRV